MNRVVFNQVPLETHHYTGWVRPVRKAVFVLFLIQFALVWVRLFVPLPCLENTRWPDGVLVVHAGKLSRGKRVLAALLRGGTIKGRTEEWLRLTRSEA